MSPIQHILSPICCLSYPNCPLNNVFGECLTQQGESLTEDARLITFLNLDAISLYSRFSAFLQTSILLFLSNSAKSEETLNLRPRGDRR